MRFVRQAVAVLFIIALPTALVTTNVRIVANEPRLYSYATDHYDTPQTTGISRAELLRASKELRAYFNSGSDAPVFIRVEQDGQLVSLFSQRETVHLKDVKNLFQTSFRVQELSVIFLLAYVVAVFIWAREESLRSLAKQTLTAALCGALAIGAIGVAALAGFDATFERFHVIAFSNDLWQLDPARDHLIQMFPEDFWLDVSLAIGAVTLAELALLAGAALAYLRLSRDDDMAFVLEPAERDRGPAEA